MRVVEGIPSKLQQQLDLHAEAPDTFKTYFIEKYVKGTMCAVNQSPREVTIFYYCDYFSTSSEFVILEISEPDWCKYHVKVATKYMCGKGNLKLKVNEGNN